MSTPQKKEIVAEVTRKLNEAKSVFLTDFKGLNVQEISDLRRAFTGASVQYLVVKNTLARLSVKEAGMDDLLEYLQGPTAMAFGMDDPVAPARVIKQFSKESDKLSVKACIVDGTFIDADKVSEIASLPSKEQLIGQLSGVLNAPITNLVYSLNGILSKFVFALNALKQQKEEN